MYPVFINGVGKVDTVIIIVITLIRMVEYIKFWCHCLFYEDTSLGISDRTLSRQVSSS